MVSICLLTMDRYAMTKYCVDDTLKKAMNVDFEVIVLDNGSEDKRVVEYGKSIADVHIEMDKNIGVSAGFNKLFKEAQGDYICTIGNDILMNENWLQDLKYYQRTIDKSGVVAIHCVLDRGIYSPLQNKQDHEKLTNVWQTPNNLVYGASLWSRELYDAIGGFDESLGKYGCEDSQYCMRATAMGYNNFYIPDQDSIHMGGDVGSNTEYRKQKDANLKIATEKMKESLVRMRKEKNYKIPLK